MATEERIAACLKFCEGLETLSLQIGPDLNEILERCVVLEELIAASEAALCLIKDKPVQKKLERAIAKAKGESP